MKLKLLFVCLLAAVLPVQAAFTSTVRASAQGIALVRSGANSQDNTTPWAVDAGVSFANVAATAYQAHLGIDNTGGGSAAARAVPGGLHVTASALGQSISGAGLANPSNWQAAGSAGGQARSSDGLVFNIAGLPAGTLITVSFGVNFNGLLAWQSIGVTPTTLGTATMGEGGWRVDLGGQGSGNTASLYTESGVITDQRTLTTGAIAGSAVVSLGDVVPLTMSLYANTTASAVGRCASDGCAGGTVSSNSLADFSNTLGWGGISALHDSNGDPIDLARLQLASDSGFDYRQAYVSAVPEPATAALWLASLTGLVFQLRRRVGLHHAVAGRLPVLPRPAT